MITISPKNGDRKSEFIQKFIFADKPSEYLIHIKTHNKIGFYPQLNALIGSIQDPIWHPEGDVWHHTLLVVDEAAKLKSSFKSEKQVIAFTFGALCHDFGKPYTLKYIDGRLRNTAHDVKGAYPTALFLSQLQIDDEITSIVINYVQEHLRPRQLYNERANISNKAILRLSNKIDIEGLIQIAKADHLGRKNIDDIKNTPHCDWLLKKYYSIKQ